MKRQSQNAMTTFDVAMQYEREGNYTRAYQLFRECLPAEGIDPGDVLFHCGWCVEQIPDKANSQAVRYYNEAAEKTAMSTVKMNSLFRSGWIRMHEKQFDRAAEYFREVLEIAQRFQEWNDIYYHAMYWYAVVLETRGRFLEALEWYRTVEKYCSELNPEARYRELCCLNKIGRYEAALKVCRSFRPPPPADFSKQRYAELQESAQREEKMLEACLADDFLTDRKP